MSQPPPRTPPRRSYRQDHEEGELPPPIYAAPTTETLGDEESVLARPYAVQTPTRYRRPLSSASDTPQTRPGNNGRVRSVVQPIKSSAASSNSTRSVDKTAFARTAPNKKPRSRRRNRAKNSNEFQIPEDFMQVSVQTVNIAQRSAFDIQPAPSLAEWNRITQHGHHRRISPSFPFLQLLHKLQSITVIRQVHFSPSVGRDSDYLETANHDKQQHQQHKTTRGRYRAIHAVQSAVSGLPKPPPVLSHKKIRQPMRADVGFPHATQQEILQKQDEIRNETAWEEASPRLAVLVTSDDLGTAVQELAVTVTPEHRAWNGGGWTGIPYAGRELLECMARNREHFRKRDAPVPLVQADPYSMLAPPLDASCSPSQGWRPRPYHDRPAGMKYFLVCPLRVQGDERGPILCKMALYSLSENGESGKMSEDFTFPAGNWTGEEGASDDGFLKRKRKAIFSYDPLKLTTGEGSLYLVTRMYQRAEQESSLWEPICFGLKRLYNKKNRDEEESQWPRGTTSEMKMYPDSIAGTLQGTFVDRLVTLVCKDTPSDSPSDCDDYSTSSMTESATKKRSVVGRLFRSPMKPTKPKTSVTLRPLPGPSLSVASATSELGCTLFVSSLSVDFLQSMLATPEELRESPGTNIPRLLVDVSGDFAVVLEVEENQQPTKCLLPPSSSYAPVKKRSSLLRLPRAPQPAGYAASSEFREILSLPVNPEKHYEYDSALSYRSLQNILFLYPRLLRLESEDGQLLEKITVRIRAIHSDGGEGGRTNQIIIESFHSAASWAEGNLVKEVFTSVSGFSSFVEGEKKTSIPMNDEFKLRLPLLLDGSFSLSIALLDVSNSEPLTIAESSIPLSSSAPIEGSSGGRIATVIPNGNHRLKLGDFQLRIETRLVSSIHLGDPSVAVLLRDFPHSDSEAVPEPSSRVLGSTSSSSLLADFFSGNTSVLAGASGSATVSHFDSLMYLHLWNLVNPGEHVSTSGVPAFLQNNTRSMFELLNKVKLSLGSEFSGDGPRGPSAAFLKKFLDGFDEGYLSPSEKWADQQSVDMSMESSAADFHIGNAHSQDENNDSNAGSTEENYGAVRIRKRSSLNSHSEIRIKRIVRSLGPSNAPFSRVAYGATKTDRMRLEAELHYQESFHAPFFDDDETIATAPTIYTDTRRGDTSHIAASGPKAGTNRSNTSMDEGSHNSILKTATGTFSTTSGIPHAGRPSNSEPEFATRVKTAAQVMLAPCVGPSLSNILLGKTSPRRPSNDKDASGKTDVPSTPATLKPCFLCTPGSDTEKLSDEDVSTGKKSTMAGSVFRGPPNSPVFEFSVRFKRNNEVPIGCGDYLYESIIVLWLRSWLDHVEARLRQNTSTSNGPTFAIPEHDLESLPTETIFCFYAHMDYLLPLCLKSMVLRYSVEVLPTHPSGPKAVLDNSHMLVLEPFVELLTRGLVGQALSGLGSPEQRDRSVLKILSSSEIVLDFLVGLLSFIHPQHMNTLLTKYFYTLRACETEHLEHHARGSDFRWNEESLHRVRCCRNLRIRAVEVFAGLPSFLAMNYPLKFSGSVKPRDSKKSSWVRQYSEINLDPHPGENASLYQDGIERLPKSAWLAELVIEEGLSVCSLSCEAVVAEAMATIEVSKHENSSSPVSKESLQKRPGAALKRDDLLMFQSLGIHAITAVYELVLRRHAMDRRYQNESSLQRVAALFAKSILSKTLSSVRWLARMESTHKIRSIWLLCFVYVLQEAPEVMIRDYVRSCCNPEDMRIHRFIRLLRLCSSTFQSFIDLHKHATLPSDIGMSMSPWLLQESFNTICVAINIIVEECVTMTSSYPKEQERMMQGLLDLLLHVLTTPQSSVTHLRAVGGALQALEQFGVDVFIQTTGSNLQHWIRVILSLMNSVSLSVRSIAVDFVVSMLGNSFDMEGNIDNLAVIFVTVLPEVAAREIGLYFVGGHISNVGDVAQSVWPLRRSLADLEDANPLDDDRVDPQLPFILKSVCRACQAVIDGVLIELRLGGNSVLGSQLMGNEEDSFTFDADEESLYEAANFFLPETAPLQRIRWLSTLRALHESKGQWVEAAEAVFLCARTITDSIPYLKVVWRPSRFTLWSDSRRSLWLETVGEDIGRPDRGNAQVMDFADDFLEPASDLEPPASATGELLQPTLPMMCRKLIELARESVNLYLREDNMNELAYARLESLQKALSLALEEHASYLLRRGISRALTSSARRLHLEEEAELRKVVASISGDMTRLAERLLLIEQNKPTTPEALANPDLALQKQLSRRPCFVALTFSGKKPSRFRESTTLPTFVEWDTPCICRVSRTLVKKPVTSETDFTELLCRNFAQPFLKALRKQCGEQSVILNMDPNADFEAETAKTIVHVTYVEASGTDPSSMSASSLLTKRFIQRIPPRGRESTNTMAVEMTVALKAPCALRRQRILLQTELTVGGSKGFFSD